MTFEMKFKVVDRYGKEVKKGDMIRLMDFSRDGEVISITDPDIDYNDAVQKPTMSNPEVTVKLDDTGQIVLNTEDETKVTWADYPDGPSEYVFGLETSAILLGKNE